MLAPFAPHPSTDTTLRGNYADLAAPCLLRGTNVAIQTPKNAANAHLRPEVDDGLIREGSHVILYTTRDSIDTIIVKKGATLDNKHGRFFHNDLIGKRYGTRVRHFSPSSSASPSFSMCLRVKLLVLRCS